MSDNNGFMNPDLQPDQSAYMPPVQPVQPVQPYQPYQPNQAVYQQPVQPIQYQSYPAVQPIQNAQAGSTAVVDKKAGNKFCIISLILLAVTGVIGSIDSYLSSYIDIPDSVTVILASFSVLCVIASIVFMIIARVKYRQNVFAKVLMWVYIAVYGVGMMTLLFMYLFLYTLCHAC